MAIYRGPGGSGDATDDAASAAELIVQKTAEAAAYSVSAASSATSAATSAASAAASASGVAGYASAAAASAAAALASENNAADSETNASASAADAADDAAIATTQATSASASASSASTSASNAATSASNAATSASSAASSASSATASASSASTSAGNASISASNAASSAALAAGYFPSVTGNTGKYLRTNGTSNYWDIVDSFPSQTGNNGKFLKTNGTVVSWAEVPNPNEATVTDSGLVFGETDNVDGVYNGNVTQGTNYQYRSHAAYSDENRLVFASGTPMYQAAIDGRLVGGLVQGIKIYDGTTLYDLGLIEYFVDFGTNVTISMTGHSLGQYGWAWQTFYADYVQLIGVKGKNTLLGYQAANNAPNSNGNTIIGYKAGLSITDGSNNIVIGTNADTSGNVSNEVTIGNTAITKTRLRGAIMVGNTTPSAGTSGQVLTSNGAGVAPSWSTPLSGTVTSVGMTVPTGLSIAGSPVTTSGTLALSLTAGYSIPTTSSQTNWDTAYGWGNHASAGYLTSATAASTYAPLTGTGASGTWGISISGNAATATALTSTLAVSAGGTGATTASGARINLGLVIGTDVPSPTGTGASGTWGISITGNAATVTNGLYSTGSYSDPTWLTTLAGSKITGTINGGTY